MKSKRFMAFFIDAAIAALLAILVNSILIFFSIRVITPMVGIFAWSIIFCKDCFSGMSIGKRIVGIQVIDANTGQIANPLKCVFEIYFIF